MIEPDDLVAGGVYRMVSSMDGEVREVVDADDKDVLWRTVAPFVPAEGVSRRIVFARLTKERIN